MIRADSEDARETLSRGRPTVVAVGTGLAAPVDPATGRVVLHGLQPGQYRLRVFASGLVTKSLLQDGRDTEFLTVGESGTTPFEIVLAKPSVITGRVWDKDGRPAPRSIVTFFPRDARSWPSSELIGYVVADNAGTFRITGMFPALLTEGAYCLAARPPWSFGDADDISFLERARNSSTCVSLRWNDLKSQDLVRSDGR